MGDLDVELWKMGITSKTKHNEVAPAQCAVALVFTTTNIALNLLSGTPDRCHSCLGPRF